VLISVHFMEIFAENWRFS